MRGGHVVINYPARRIAGSGVVMVDENDNVANLQWLDRF